MSTSNAELHLLISNRTKGFLGTSPAGVATATVWNHTGSANIGMSPYGRNQESGTSSVYLHKPAGRVDDIEQKRRRVLEQLVLRKERPGELPGTEHQHPCHTTYSKGNAFKVKAQSKLFKGGTKGTSRVGTASTARATTTTVGRAQVGWKRARAGDSRWSVVHAGSGDARRASVPIHRRGIPRARSSTMGKASVDTRVLRPSWRSPQTATPPRRPGP